MRICVVAQPGECLQVKADMVLFAGNIVLFISEHIRGVCVDSYTNRRTLHLLYTICLFCPERLRHSGQVQHAINIVMSILIVCPRDLVFSFSQLCLILRPSGARGLWREGA